MQIVVLGAHESGAEEVACLINAMAVGAENDGVTHDGGANTALNAWGQLAVQRLNDHALTALGGSWVNCGDLDLNAMPEGEWSDLQRTANHIINSLDERRTWAVHDPLMSLLLRLWQPLLTRPLYVLAHRSGAATARLTRERHGLSTEIGLALWERYNIAALSNTANFPRTLVNCDRLMSDPHATAQRLRSELLELGVERLSAPPADVLQAIERMAGESRAAWAEEESANQAQQQLDACLVDGTALHGRPLPLSASASVALQRAGNRWVEQRWLRALLRKRNQQLRSLRGKLRSLRAQLINAGRRPETRQGSLQADRTRGVFVIGCPRSGTSILSWALARHPNFWTSGESDYLLKLFGGESVEDVYGWAHERLDAGWLQKQRVGFAEFAAMMGVGAERLFDSRAEGRRWVDATPSYALIVEDLLRLFPAASFLHIVRDGRAVVNSMLSSGFDEDWATDFDTACRTWVHYASLGSRAAAAHSDRIMEVRHEDLARSPWSELQRVFGFLGERVAPDSIKIILNERINSSYGNASADDMSKSKDPATAPTRPWEAWSDAHKAAFAEIAGETMRELGYGGLGEEAPSRTSPRVSPIS